MVGLYFLNLYFYSVVSSLVKSVNVMEDLGGKRYIPKAATCDMTRARENTFPWTIKVHFHFTFLVSTI